MRAASEHLSSVTLELGGKSPTIVDETADLDAAAMKIAWGKFTNGGQTCIAPDYIFVHASKFDPFITALKYHTHAMYNGGDVDGPFTPIINQRHFDRLTHLLTGTLQAGAKVEEGGKADAEKHLIPPTILTHVSMDAPAMQEEIFGPVLPVLAYDTLEDVIDTIQSRPRPLTMYVFSENEETTERLMTETQAGTTCINDTLLHFGNPRLPFGGVNTSGIGKSHGYSGFLAFSNERAVMVQKKKESSL